MTTIQLQRAGIAFLIVLVTACASKQASTPPSEDVVGDGSHEQAVAVERAAVEPAPPPPWYAGLSADELNIEASSRGFHPDIYFAFNDASLSADARQKLQKSAQFLQQNPTLKLTIEGHCDERGSNEYNLQLGQRRATSAADYLNSLGIDNSRLKTITYGEQRPVCTESTDQCWARNRRDRLVLGP